MVESGSSPGRELPKLSELEWEIIKPLWKHGPMAARDIYGRVPKENNWAYKTVKTLLSRLVAKGALDYEQIGNSYLYRAAVAREQMTRREVRGLFQRVMGAALSPVLANFIEEAELSEEEIRQLKRALDKKRVETQRNKKKK